MTLFDFPGSDEMIKWGVIILGSLIVFVIVAKISKSLALNKAHRQHWEVGVTLDDLEKMKKTGLVGDEEMKRLRRRVSETVIEATLPASPSQSAEITMAEAIREARARKKPAGERKPPQPVETPEPDAVAAPRPEPQAPATLGDFIPPPRPAKKPKTPDGSYQSLNALLKKKRKQSGISNASDIEALRQSGQIDEAQYQRLRTYFDQEEDA